MNDSLVRFRIPAPYVLERAIPTAAELGFGYHHGWLSQEDTVAIAAAKGGAGAPLLDAEKELAQLLPDDFIRVDPLAEELEVSDEPVERRARLWLFLALAWVYDHRSEFADPFETIEMLYADFDYPEEIQGLVRYMPAKAGEDVGLDAIDKRWRQYLNRKADEYQERDRSNLTTARLPPHSETSHL